jgi:hypothetical protein
LREDYIILSEKHAQKSPKFWLVLKFLLRATTFGLLFREQKTMQQSTHKSNLEWIR